MAMCRNGVRAMETNIGFISTRFEGIDGVSLEATKWAQVLTRNGFHCYWMAGKLDRPEDLSLLVPEAFFQHPTVVPIQNSLFGLKRRDPKTTAAIHLLREHLKKKIYTFIERFQVDMLVVENALTIPMNIPLGLALTEVIAETGIATIVHHHDFYWERERFSLNAAEDYLCMAFPPRLPSLTHVVINSIAQQQLAHRTGLPSTLIPNVLDFETPPKSNYLRSLALRQAMGLKPEDRIILQPTRMVPRKGIEHAIDLVRRLGDPRYKLLVSHQAGDEGYQYARYIESLAQESGISMIQVDQSLADPIDLETAKTNKLSLWDIYALADLVTYPSSCEGFGNALLEAIYFSKPVLVNRYDTFIRDIEPLGFHLISFDGYLTEQVVSQVSTTLQDAQKVQAMVAKNYQIAQKHYGYDVLEKSLLGLIEKLLQTETAWARLPVQSTSASEDPFDLQMQVPINRLAV